MFNMKKVDSMSLVCVSNIEQTIYNEIFISNNKNIKSVERFSGCLRVLIHGLMPSWIKT